ncbi:hypothetical protein K9M74_03925 [Candidatus Woesearchaeota archaeon]|nr:hypothetical protein [Candidatus Woesearchaeota archaeon]
MEGATKEDFMKELEEVSEQLKNLAEETPQADPPQKRPAERTPHIMPSTPFLSVTILFLLVFFFLYSLPAQLYQLIAFLFLILASLSGVQYVADLLDAKKRTLYETIIGVVVIFTLAISYYMVWSFIATYFLYVMVLLGVILGLGSLFFLLHAYLGYLRRAASYETGITALIMVGAWIAFLATILKTSMVYFLLFVVLLILFSKASIDFSERFREKKNS